ncbi:MAG: hypothetical protein ACK4LQ_06460 [Pararhodobacter sp.]
MRIIVHIGAHKTASTHLQLALERGRAALGARGVAVFGPDQLRRRGLGLPEYLSAPAGSAEAHGARIRAALGAGAERLVVSDENILGNAHNVELIRTGRFYPRAASRLQALLALLPAGEVTLALAIRDPARFLTSAYAQRLMSGKLEPFADYIGALQPATLRWSDLVGRLRGVVPGAGWHIWRYEDYPAVAPRVLDVLLGGHAALARPGPGIAHPGLSARAHAALMAEAAALAGLGEAAIRARVAELRRAFPKAPDAPGMALFDADALRRSAAAYGEDTLALAALPGVCVLEPPCTGGKA